MGVDAEMMIIYKGEYPSDDELTRWSWDLCNSIGARHFFVSDGLPPEEYDEAHEKWHEAFNNHPKYKHWKAGDESAHPEIIKDIGEPPKELRRAIELSNRRYPLEEDSDVPEKYRKPGYSWVQDGDPILASPGEIFLEISLWSRYYGEGYERGDILTICAVAEWVEVNMQPCEVWYGGDSSGVLMEPFGEQRRKQLREHLYSDEGRGYFACFSEGEKFRTPEPCGLCVKGENRFVRYGWGNKYIAVNCGGCGKRFQSWDNGITWESKADE